MINYTPQYYCYLGRHFVKKEELSPYYQGIRGGNRGKMCMGCIHKRDAKKKRQREKDKYKRFFKIV